MKDYKLEKDFLKSIPLNELRTLEAEEILSRYRENLITTHKMIEVSNEEIEKEVINLSKTFIKDYSLQIRVGLERGIELYRKQLTGK